MGIVIRPSAKVMPKYVPGRPISDFQREFGHREVIKLASNENPLGPSPLALEALLASAPSCSYYPDASCHDLKQRLADIHQIGPECIVVGNGSDEIINLLGLILLTGVDDEVIVGDPSFIRYDAVAQMAGCQLVKVPLDSNFRLDLPHMASSITPNTKIIFIANPNNPTGTIVARGGLLEFLRRVPSHVAVVLDEAYFEFAKENQDYQDGRELLGEFANLVVLRTFSKAYGLAGLRVGYGFAAAQTCDAIDRVRGPFNVNSLAQSAARAALSDQQHLERTIDLNRAGRAVLQNALTELGATVASGDANFVYADFGYDVDPLLTGLLDKGIIVRGGSPLGTPTGLRISVGTEHQVETVIGALALCVRDSA